MARRRRTVLVVAFAIAAVLGLASAQPASAWTVAGSGEGVYSVSADGGLLFYCPDGDGPPEADVGPYGLTPGTEYALTFEVEGRDPLRLTSRVGPATAVQLTGEDTTTLIAFLEGAPTTTVTMALARMRLPGGPVSFDVPTFGLASALAELRCGLR